MPPRLTRAESREQTRNALIKSARAVFARLGYSRATLDLIAEDAGYTKGAVYSNFESKEALFLELLALMLKGSIEQLDMLITRLQGNPDAMLEEVGYWVDLVDERYDLPLLLLEIELETRRVPALAPKFTEIITSHEAEMAALQRRLFAELGRDPLIPPDQLAPSVIMLAEGYALARQTRNSSKHFASTPIRALNGFPTERKFTEADPKREFWAEPGGK